MRPKSSTLMPRVQLPHFSMGVSTETATLWAALAFTFRTDLGADLKVQRASTSSVSKSRRSPFTLRPKVCLP